jgi:hypothetical protein
MRALPNPSAAPVLRLLALGSLALSLRLGGCLAGPSLDDDSSPAGDDDDSSPAGDDDDGTPTPGDDDDDSTSQGDDDDSTGQGDDDDATTPAPVDADGDGYTSDVDCDDSNSSVNPGASEPCACDAIDQNCNGVVDDFPCDMACDYAGVGEVCPSESGAACEPGLVCCYPCGIPDCDWLCQEPCFGPECSGGCPMLP